MRKLFYFFFMAILISSCSETDIDKDFDDNNGNGNGNNDNDSVKTENTIPILKLSVKENQKNIFEHMEFSLYSENAFTLLDLTETYDSIVWKVSDLEGNFKIMKQDDGTHFTFKWSQNFFLPAEYKAMLLGYKNDKVLCGDTISVKITNDKDFLGYNWEDIKGSIGHSEGYVDVLSNKTFFTRQEINQGIPSVILFLRQNNKEEDDSVFIQKSEKILSDYISTLYSVPNYNVTDDLLVEKYNQLFTYKEENTYPQSIWLTPKAKIVLLKSYNGDFYEYEIYAEPSEK